MDLRLDSQRGPLDTFVLLPELFKVGSIKGVTWLLVSQLLTSRPLISGPRGGELGHPEAAGGTVCI